MPKIVAHPCALRIDGSSIGCPTAAHTIVPQDIKLCGIAMQRAGDRIAPTWRFVLYLLGGVRRWLFLPALVMVVPMLVLYKGGDALSICFNSVALLFLCELDNLAYAVLLPERLRAWVEHQGRVDLEQVEVEALIRSKAVHVTVLSVALPCSVVIGGNGGLVGLGWVLTFFPSFVAWWVASVVEVVLVPDSNVGERCKEVGKVTSRLLLGLTGGVVLLMASFLRPSMI